MIETLTGIASGILIILIVRLLRGQHWMYSIGLPVLPSLYALFAISVGAHAVGLKEMIYGLPFIAAGLLCALTSIRRSAIVVGIFWILHGAFDLLHARLLLNPGLPAWYPVWCCAIDVVVGAYLLWLSTSLPTGDLRRA